MKKYLFTLLYISCLFISCAKEETYEDLINKETSAIDKFVKDNGIKIISLEQFRQNNQATSISKSEYVDLGDIYLQIIKAGGGEKMISHYDVDYFYLYVRCNEQNIITQEITFDNFTTKYPDMISYYSLYYNAQFCNLDDPDKGFYVPKDGFRAKYRYTAEVIPYGWYKPIEYISPGHTEKDCSRIKVIVPSSSGGIHAKYKATPFIYEISYIRRK